MRYLLCIGRIKYLIVESFVRYWFKFCIIHEIIIDIYTCHNTQLFTCHQLPSGTMGTEETENSSIPWMRYLRIMVPN